MRPLLFKLSDSIPKKFTLVVFFLLIFLLIVTGTVIFIIEKRDALNKQYVIGNNLVQHIGYALENWVFDQIGIAKTIALDKDIIALSKNPTDENLRQVVKSRLLQIHAIYPQAEAIDVCPKLKKDEKIIKMIDGKSVEITSGKILVSTVGEHVVGMGGQDHAMVVIDGEQEYSISEIYPSFTDGKPIFVITVPIRENNEIIGVVAFVIKMGVFSKRFLVENRVGKTGYPFMIDNRGSLIGHPQEKLIMSKNELRGLSAIDKKVIEGSKFFYETFENRYRLYITYKIAIPLQYIENQWYLIFGQNVDEILQGPHRFLKILAVIGIIFLILTTGLLRFLTVRAFEKPLNKVIYALRDISEREGDLTKSLNIKSKDEIGKLAHYFDNFTFQLRRLIKSIVDKFLNIKDKSDDLQRTSKEFSSVIANQSRKLGSVATSIDIVHTNTGEVLSNVKTARESAANGAEKAAEGKKMLNALVDNIEHLNSNTKLLSKSVKNLNSKIGEINRILSFVNDIADKINLLSLNANIEAARAGEMGRGFAVVAEEVRKLAYSTQKSIQEISMHINDIVDNSKETVVNMGEASKSVEESALKTEEIKEVFGIIVDVVNKIYNTNKKIEDLIKSQSDEFSIVNEDIQSIAAGFEENTKSVRYIVEIIDGLNINIDALNKLVARFKI